MQTSKGLKFLIILSHREKEEEFKRKTKVFSSCRCHLKYRQKSILRWFYFIYHDFPTESQIAFGHYYHRK